MEKNVFDSKMVLFFNGLKKSSTYGPWFIENTCINVNVNMNSNQTSDL